MNQTKIHIILILILAFSMSQAQNNESMSLIDQYITKYDIFRESSTWDSLKFNNGDGESEIAKQIERYKLGVGLFNKLNLNEDYEFVSFMFDQELQLRKSNIENQNPDVLYLYAFFLSRFKQIEDVWKFLEAKYIDFDSGIGFDTYYFMTFGIDEIYNYATTTQNEKKDLLLKTIGTKKEDIYYDQEEFQRWEKGKYEYYDFIKPIKRPLDFYRLFNHKDLFKTEFTNWIKTVDLSDSRTAYDCIHMAEFADDKETLIIALENYLKHDKNGILYEQFKRRLLELKKD